MLTKQTPARMKQLVTRWRTSGESGAGFAKRHGIPPWTFWYWCRKRLPTRPKVSTSPQFVPVHVAPAADGAVIEIVVPDGTRLHVRAGASAELLRTVIAAVRATC
ncbi:MAG: hypothetical protein FJ202_13160 [Gemmatimonadetes bacterium]|nr:hypothetical protein [Gemmatimonadota bacterium]